MQIKAPRHTETLLFAGVQKFDLDFNNCVVHEWIGSVVVPSLPRCTEEHRSRNRSRR